MTTTKPVCKQIKCTIYVYDHRGDMDHVDHDGSLDGKKGIRPVVTRESMKSAFHIRLTASKIVDQEWITGSHEQAPFELMACLKELFPKGGINYEIGKGGQEHFQIHVFCPKGKRNRRKVVREHLLATYPDLCFPELDYCDGCTNVFASDNYCRKTDTAVAHWDWGGCSRDWTAHDFNALITLTPAQQQVADMFEEECPPFHTTIYWFWNHEGQDEGFGKTMLQRWLILNKGFYMCAGTGEKLRHLAANNPAPGYCLNLSRAAANKMSYQGLESVNDAVYADTFGSDMKGQVIRKASYVTVFANFPPAWHEISQSRWKVFEYSQSQGLMNTLEPPQAAELRKRKADGWMY